jgi:hypothetical protein
METATAIYRENKTVKEVLAIAKEKANLLENRKMIRLFADENYSFYLYKEGGAVYIGSYVNSESEKEMPNFFANKEIFYLTNNETKVNSMKFQRML